MKSKKSADQDLQWFQEIKVRDGRVQQDHRSLDSALVEKVIRVVQINFALGSASNKEVWNKWQPQIVVDLDNNTSVSYQVLASIFYQLSSKHITFKW